VVTNKKVTLWLLSGKIIPIKSLKMNIIINGGTRGIGKEVTLHMAEDINNKILVTGRDEKALKEISSPFTNVHPLRLDISSFDTQSDLFIKAVNSYFKGVDVLINMAGLLIARDFTEITNKEARLIMETNFLGPAAVIRSIKPLMNKGSHIVNISSMGGFQGSSKYKGLSYYSASKAALACLSECLAAEFTDAGISVNCLALGSVQTDMFEEAFPGQKAQVSPKEMAEYISDFAMKGSRFYNGKVLPVAINNP